MNFDQLKEVVGFEFCSECKRSKANCIKKITALNNEEYPSKSTPGTLKYEIKDKREKAIQRAILGLVGKSIIYPSAETTLDKSPPYCKEQFENKTIYWIDMELPVIFSKNSRRTCIDLLGLSGEQPVVCELKFVNNDGYLSNCPIYAAMELLSYHLYIVANQEKLKNENIRHKFVEKHPKDIGSGIWTNYDKNNPILLVAANIGYWKKWTDISLESFKKLSDRVGVSIMPYSFVDISFCKKDGKELYKEDDVHCPGLRHKEVSDWHLIA